MDVKPLTKNEFILKELASEGYYPSEQAVERILDGDEPEFFEPALIDYILDAGFEWDDKNK